MFSLRSAAGRFQDDVFHPWNRVSKTFDTSASAQIVGRLFRVDRFTTIYHRPTRRRQITLPPSVTPPESLTLRHFLSGDVMILAQHQRKDVTVGAVYDNVISTHLATAPSGGLGTLYRPTTQGPVDNPGLADLDEVCQAYADVELRTTQEEPNAIEQGIGQVLLTTPAWVSWQDNDWFLLNGSYYKIVEPYIDGGFMAARAIKESVDLVAITYYYDTGEGGTYDPQTGTFTPVVTEEKQISAIMQVRKDSSSPSISSEAWRGTAYINANHITWTPRVNHSILHAGVRYKIMSVALSQSRTQWELELLQWQGITVEGETGSGSGAGS